MHLEASVPVCIIFSRLSFHYTVSNSRRLALRHKQDHTSIIFSEFHEKTGCIGIPGILHGVQQCNGPLPSKIQVAIPDARIIGLTCSIAAIRERDVEISGKLGPMRDTMTIHHSDVVRWTVIEEDLAG